MASTATMITLGVGPENDLESFLLMGLESGTPPPPPAFTGHPTVGGTPGGRVPSINPWMGTAVLGLLWLLTGGDTWR